MADGKKADNEGVAPDTLANTGIEQNSIAIVKLGRSEGKAADKQTGHSNQSTDTEKIGQQAMNVADWTAPEKPEIGDQPVESVAEVDQDHMVSEGPGKGDVEQADRQAPVEDGALGEKDGKGAPEARGPVSEVELASAATDNTAEAVS
jgi:hypothetical protein